MTKKLDNGTVVILIIVVIIGILIIKPDLLKQEIIGEECVSNEPDTIEGYYNEFKDLYGDNITILGSIYTLNQGEGLLGYINNQGNAIIMVIPIELLGTTSCDSTQSKNSDRFVSIRSIDGVEIYRSRRSISQQAEQGDSFCSQNDLFKIQFEPVWDIDRGGIISEVLELENKYFQTFYTCTTPIECSDGTQANDCSTANTGKLCTSGFELVDSILCEEEVPETCGDGTYVGYCSVINEGKKCSTSKVLVSSLDCKDCPILPTKLAGWCSNGNIISGGVDVEGCPKADICEIKEPFFRKYGVIILIIAIVGVVLYAFLNKK